MARPSSIESFFFFLLLFLLPTQLGYHFWPPYTTVLGFRVDYLAPTLFATDILILILFVCFLFRRPVLPSFPPRTVSLGIIFICLQLLITRQPLITLYSFWKIAEMTFLGYYVAKSLSLVQKKYVLSALATGVVLQLFLATMQFFHQGSLGGMAYWFGERTFTIQTPGIATAGLNGALVLRPYGTLPHPNVLAGYLLISLLLILSLSLKQSNKQKIVSGLMLLGVSIGIFLSMSRTVLVLTGFVFASTLLFLYRQRRLWLFSLCVGSLLLASLLFFPSPLFSRFTHLFTQQSFIERKELFLSAWQLFLGQPVLGVGLGMFIPHLSLTVYQGKTLFSLQPVHTIYMLTLVEGGIYGVLLLFSFLFATAKHMLHARTDYFVYCAFAVVLLIGFVDHYFFTLQQGQLLFALVMGFCWQETGKRTAK